MGKVGLYLDDEIWRKFKEEVFRKHGSLRKLSDEVEELLRSSLTAEAMLAGLEKLGTKLSGMSSSEQVMANRPTLRGPSAEKIVRSLRDHRLGKVLSRQ